MKRSLLLIEKEGTLRQLCCELQSKETIKLISAADVPRGLDLLRGTPSLNIMAIDYDLIRNEAHNIIPEIKSIRPNVLLLIAGQASNEELIECMKLGADEFIEDPLTDCSGFVTYIERYLSGQRKELGDGFQKEFEFLTTETNRLVGQSRAMLDLKKLIYKIAPLDSTVLILGETGTGKEVVARMIHSLSPQRQHNFLAVHCGGIPDTLLESTLFGHEKGAFTGAYRTHKGYFEVADKGTILLDEIGDTTPSFQVKLLRVLQDKQFRRVGGTEALTTSARVIAATNRDLKQLVDQGQFREDMYYRLNVINLRVPPLRERPEDIPLLVRYFMQIFSKKHSHLGVYLKQETLDILEKQPWRGNVRELENVIERLVALSDSDWIGSSELPPEYMQSPQFNFLENAPFLPYAEAKNLFEKEYIANLLRRANGNISKAAKLADMPRQNLHLKIKKHCLKAKEGEALSAKVKENPITIED
jgi:DNA-binding NtrC family response regulator